MAFEERYRLLLASGQASEETIAATQFVVKLVESRYGINLTEALGSMLVSHLAITLRRLKDGEMLSDMPNEVWNELRQYPDDLQFATEVVERIEGLLGMPLPRSEIGFLTVHLIKLRIDIEQERNKKGGASKKT